MALTILTTTDSAVLNNIDNTSVIVPDGTRCEAVYSYTQPNRVTRAIARATGGISNCGSLDYPARADHSHPLNVMLPSQMPSGTAVKDYVKGIATTASFGTSPYYARLDHEHTMNVEMGGATNPADSWTRNDATADCKNRVAGFTLRDDGWVIEGATKGFIEYYACRAVQSGSYRYMVWRMRKVSKTGVITYRSAELGCSLT